MALSAALMLGTFAGLFQLANKAWLLFTHERTQATVTACQHEFFNRGKGLAGKGQGRRDAKYAPVATTRSGIEITGMVYASHQS